VRHLIVIPGDILHLALLQGQRHPSAVVHPQRTCEAQDVAATLRVHHVPQLHSGNAAALASLRHLEADCRRLLSGGPAHHSHFGLKQVHFDAKRPAVAEVQCKHTIW
jgi:hypothetical protein